VSSPTQTEIGNDPGLVRGFAQTAEGLGYTRQVVFDHVLGAGLASRPRWEGTYDADDPFYEPFVLFGYLAGLTERIELVTGVLVLPQRQTASSPSKLPRLTSVRRPDATGRRRRVERRRVPGARVPDGHAVDMLARLRGFTLDAGRNPAQIGIDARVERRYGERERWPELIARWRDLGATDMVICTRGLGLSGAEHITAIEELHRELVG